MLEFLEIKIDSADIVVEWLWAIREDVLLERPKKSTALAVVLVTFEDLSEEMVNVH